jgi:peptidoglycan-N-acetylglucosamine deacetylase
MNWMNDSRVAVLLTFDFDAETLWIARDAANWERPGTLSQGTYGAKVGVPKILELLKEEQLPATFFVPGWTAEFHRAQTEAIAQAGHEIGHHGYLHEWIDPSRPELELEALEKGIDALHRIVGKRPLGYRSPAGETSHNVFRLLKEKGFLYDSSMLDDYTPYRSTLLDGTPGVVEIPWHWSLDDAIYCLFHIKSPRAVFTNEHILQIWKDEFDAIRAWGGVFNLVMHPQVIGRPSRLTLLRQFIAYTRSFGDVSYGTCADVARWFGEREPPFTRARHAIQAKPA